jgi:hypothetical protein
MTKTLVPPPPHVVAKMRAVAERRLSAEEFDAYVNAPMDDFEREQIRGLIAWFRRRYPTPAERLAYARRAYRRWAAAMPPSK